MDMARFKYSYDSFNSDRHARASIRELDISHKHAREIAVAIKGMSIDTANQYLEDVVEKRRAVPFRRYKEQVGHRSDPGVMAGRYPQKAARAFIRLLADLEANAEFQGFDTDVMKIVNVTVHKGRILKRFMPRAMGRNSARNDAQAHVEIVAEEMQ